MSLRERHPSVILIFFGAVLVVTMATRHPAVALLSFSSAALLRLRLAGPGRTGKSLLYLIPMILMMVIFNSLFNDRGMTLLFSWGALTVTLESVAYGLVSGLILSAVMLWFQSYNDLMDNGRFLALLGGKLPVISMMVSMIFRFIPQTMAHGREIEINRRALVGQPTKRLTLPSAIRMTSILMAWSMENAIETADAMKAKAFDSGKRRAYGRIRRTADDLPPLLMTLLFLILLAMGWIWGGSRFLYYPYLAIPDRAGSGGALLLWLGGALGLFLTPFLTAGLSWVLDQVRYARRQPLEIDPMVRAMLPRIKEEAKG